ncbi:MAG: hypothetical protein AAF582_00025 [Pseudomonadota bacterium]
MTPIRKSDLVTGMRQRQRANGTWRVWWEPSADARARGHTAVDLDPERPTWSIQKAKSLNAAAAPDKGMRAGSGGRSIDALIENYKRSRHFLEKRPATQRSYKIEMRAISDKWGTFPAIEFTKPIMNEWFETLLQTGKSDWAKHLLGMMSILMDHAERIGWRAENSNPCFRMKRGSSTKRSRVATWAEYDALIAAADQLADEGKPVFSAVAAAIALSTLCGQRREDLLQAQLAAFSDHKVAAATGRADTVLIWQLTRSKRSTAGVIPIHAEAAPRIRKLMDAARPGQTHLLALEGTGYPITGNYLSQLWRAVRARAAESEPGVADLQFRDLRRTFGNWARKGGAVKSDVADVLGNQADQDAGLSEIYMAPSLEGVTRALEAVQRPKKAG